MMQSSHVEWIFIFVDFQGCVWFVVGALQLLFSLGTFNGITLIADNGDDPSSAQISSTATSPRYHRPVDGFNVIRVRPAPFSSSPINCCILAQRCFSFIIRSDCDGCICCTRYMDGGISSDLDLFNK